MALLPSGGMKEFNSFTNLVWMSDTFGKAQKMCQMLLKQNAEEGGGRDVSDRLFLSLQCSCCSSCEKLSVFPVVSSLFICSFA